MSFAHIERVAIFAWFHLQRKANFRMNLIFLQKKIIIFNLPQSRPFIRGNVSYVLAAVSDGEYIYITIASFLVMSTTLLISIL